MSNVPPRSTGRRGGAQPACRPADRYRSPTMTATADLAVEHAGIRVWRQELAPYARPHVPRSVLDLATSVLPYALLSAAMYWLLGYSYALTLLLAIPTAGFLLRTYIL